MNPKFTAGLPAYQTFVGVADVLSHLLERYFSDEKYSDTTDYLIEGAVRALLVNADRLLSDPSDINARGEVQWLQVWLIIISLMPEDGLTGDRTG